MLILRTINYLIFPYIFFFSLSSFHKEDDFTVFLKGNLYSLTKKCMNNFLVYQVSEIVSLIYIPGVMKTGLANIL